MTNREQKDWYYSFKTALKMAFIIGVPLIAVLSWKLQDYIMGGN